MAEKAVVVGAFLLLLSSIAAACGGSDASSSAAPTDASTGDAAPAPHDATLPPLALAPDPVPPDCNRQTYDAIVTYLPDFEARRASGDVQTRVGLVHQVADLAPLVDAVRWLRDLAGCEADPNVRGAAIAGLTSHGERVLAPHLPRGVGIPNELWPQPDLAAARAQAAGSDASAGWAALHLSIYGDGSDIVLLDPLTRDENVFARFAAAIGFIGIDHVERAGPVLDAIARAPTAPGNHFYIERALLVLRALGDKGALADLVAFLDQIEESPEPNDVVHTKTVLTLLEIIAGEAHTDAAAWRAWLESTGQPSVSARR